MKQDSVFGDAPAPCFCPDHFWSRSRGRVLLILGSRPDESLKVFCDYFASRGYDITLILERHSLEQSYSVLRDNVTESFSLPDIGLCPFTTWRFLRSIIMTRCVDVIVGSDSVAYVEMLDQINSLTAAIVPLQISGTSTSQLPKSAIHSFQRKEGVLKRRIHDFIRNSLSHETELPSTFETF